jgi:hypothetical protein
MFNLKKMTILWKPSSLSVETRYLSYSITTLDRKHFTTNKFLSFDMLTQRISLLSDSIATYNKIYSGPSLSWFS